VVGARTGALVAGDELGVGVGNMDVDEEVSFVAEDVREVADDVADVADAAHNIHSRA
jgi:hypothetical protein